MLETITLVTLVFLYLHFFRSGKTPSLENPLHIVRPGKYTMSLAPRLNLAQPYIESIANHIDTSQNGAASVSFTIQDKQVYEKEFVLIINYSDGMLTFQAELPPQQANTAHEIAHPEISAMLITSVQRTATERGITAKLI